MAGKKAKILMVAPLTSTLYVFYGGLIQRLKKIGYEVTVAASEDYFLDRLEEQINCKVVLLDIRRSISPLQDLNGIMKLSKLIKKERFDIVHAHTPKAGMIGMLAARLSGVKNRLYTCHGLPFETESGFRKKLLLWIERLSCSLAGKVIVVSSSLHKQVRLYKTCPLEKLVMLNKGTACGVDLKRFTLTNALIEEGRALRAKHHIPDDCVVIGFIGRLVPDKGVHILTESFTALYKKFPRTRLIIIGDFEPHRGKLPAETEEIISNHPGIIHIKFAGCIELYYAAMNMLVLPTRREGFPYALLEASAMSLPVIATKVTGCVDAVQDGITGLLVEPDNPGMLYEAMLKLAENPHLRQMFGKAGRRRAEELFDSEILINEHVGLYKELLDNNSFHVNDENL